MPIRFARVAIDNGRIIFYQYIRKRNFLTLQLPSFFHLHATETSLTDQAREFYRLANDFSWRFTALRCVKGGEKEVFSVKAREKRSEDRSREKSSKYKSDFKKP